MTGNASSRLLTRGLSIPALPSNYVEVTNQAFASLFGDKLPPLPSFPNVTDSSPLPWVWLEAAWGNSGILGVAALRVLRLAYEPPYELPRFLVSYLREGPYRPLPTRPHPKETGLRAFLALFPYEAARMYFLAAQQQQALREVIAGGALGYWEAGFSFFRPAFEDCKVPHDFPRWVRSFPLLTNLVVVCRFWHLAPLPLGSEEALLDDKAVFRRLEEFWTSTVSGNGERDPAIQTLARVQAAISQDLVEVGRITHISAVSSLV